MKGQARPVVGPDGVDYPSVRAAAKALGQPPLRLWHHLKLYGHLRNIGEDMLRVPVIYKGITYESIAECCRKTGISHSSAQRHLRRYGHLDKVRIGKGWKKGEVPKNSRPLRIGPWVFPSRFAAARELGVNITTIYRHLRGEASEGEREAMLKRLINYQPSRSKDAARRQ